MAVNAALKFEEFPLSIPKFPKLEKKFNTLLTQFENASSAKEQKKLMLKLGKFFDEVSTDFTIISVRHTIDPLQSAQSRQMLPW